MALRFYKTDEDLGCRNHILILDVFVVKKMKKCLLVNWEKKPELKPNRKEITIYTKRKRKCRKGKNPARGREGNRYYDFRESPPPSQPPATCDPVHAVDGVRSSEVCEREVDLPPPH